jgi:GNAT superfamily N-acetyltransferase
MIRKATEDDVGRIMAIAHAAYIKYVPRLGRKPPPMLADFAAEVAAGHVVVIEVARTVEGYLISWPKMEAYFIDNIAVDPAHQGLGMGRQLMEYAVREAKRHNLSAIQLYTQRDNDRESRDVRQYGICRNPSCDGDAIPYRDRFSSGLYVSHYCLGTMRWSPRLQGASVLLHLLTGIPALVRSWPKLTCEQ